jgi:signal transduction histidine kinase
MVFLTIKNWYSVKARPFISFKDMVVDVPKSSRQLFVPLFPTKSKGQSLGLAVVKRLIEGLNVKINFEKLREKGNEITITLSLDQEDGSPENRKKKPAFGLFSYLKLVSPLLRLL